MTCAPTVSEPANRFNVTLLNTKDTQHCMTTCFLEKLYSRNWRCCREAYPGKVAEYTGTLQKRILNALFFFNKLFSCNRMFCLHALLFYMAVSGGLFFGNCRYSNRKSAFLFIVCTILHRCRYSASSCFVVAAGWSVAVCISAWGPLPSPSLSLSVPPPLLVRLPVR